MFPSALMLHTDQSVFQTHVKTFHGFSHISYTKKNEIQTRSNMFISDLLDTNVASGWWSKQKTVCVQHSICDWSCRRRVSVRR